MTELQRLRNLEVPTGNIDCVLDTDTYNEIDDQYALSLMIKSPKLNLRAIYAAPFFNTHSTSPEDGMERSYDEILKLLTLMGKEDKKPTCSKAPAPTSRMKKRRWTVLPPAICASWQ